jgi:GTP cyclohydrolase IB
VVHTDMIDVQNLEDTRKLPLQKVGVKNLQYPIRVLDKVHKIQHTSATVNLYVDLPHHFRGTHMSRFIEVFNKHYTDLAMPKYLHMLDNIRKSLEAETAYGEVNFPYFIEKKAPVSSLKGMMEYSCQYIGKTGKDVRDFIVGITVPVTTVCPCSKEISTRGAHNQRSLVHIEVKLGPFFWIEDIIDVVERSASSGVYALLKREDEKYITEYAYDNPVFVEDLVREVTINLEKLNHFPWFSVEAENYESIHNHNAYAYIERGERK